MASALTRWYNDMTRSSSSSGSGASLMKNKAVKTGVESIATGAALGAIAANRVGGLDATFKVGSTNVTVPMDGVGAALALFVGQKSDDLRNVGGAAASVFAFRKTQELIASKKGAATAHGDFDAISEGNWGSEEDPLIAAARALG